MPVISVLNRKGGVAKTTSTLNLAGVLSSRGMAVLCVDCDPQATLSLFAGYGDCDPEETVLAALLPEKFDLDTAALTVEAPWGGDLWRATGDLAQADNDLMTAPGPHNRLRTAVDDHAHGYDIVLVDSPPSVGKLFLNTVVAADHLVVPVGPDLASLGGLDKMWRTLELTRRYERCAADVLGVFITRKRTPPTLDEDEAVAELQRVLGDTMMDVIVPTSAAVPKAVNAKLPVSQFAPGTPAAEAYEQLADRITARLADRGVTLTAKAAA